jgi:penicillin amidase
MATAVPIPDEALLATLGGDQTVAALCRATGASEADVAAARAAFLARRLPPRNAELRAAIGTPVEILRDRAGVPHVWAETTEDLFFGLGFAMTQDRLWQMDRLRRRALGRQAEVMGRDYLASDLQHRIVGIDRIAKSEAARLDGEPRLIVDALATGINRGIETFGADLPIEFVLLGYEPDPFGVVDLLAILRGMWWSLNGRLPTLTIAEAASLLPEELRAAFWTPAAPEARILPPDAPWPSADLPLRALLEPAMGFAGEGDASGSNNWAVAGSRTAGGKPVLASDPHQPFWLPSSWYEYGLHGPEDDIVGAGHPGVPAMFWGMNGRIAWGITNDGSSTRDLYREEVHPESPALYRDGDRWLPFGEEEIVIPLRGEAPQRHLRRSTVRGPICNDFLPPVREGGDPPLALRWVGQEPIDDVQTLLNLNRARGWPEFRDALAGWAIPIFNWVCADVDGNIGYQQAGRVPVRGRVKLGYREANESLDEWRGYVPFAALARLENPSRGWVGSANNRPVPDGYPFPFYGVAAAGYRFERIQAVVEATAPFDAAAAGRLQNDVVGVRAARTCPALLDRLAGSDDPDVRLLVETLRAWDHAYTVEATAPLLFETLMTLWGERVAAARFPARLAGLVSGQTGPAYRLIETDDLPWWPDGRTTATELHEAAKEAVTKVRERYGADPAGWRWGAAHQVLWRHPLSNDAVAADFDLGPSPCPGCADTVNNTGTGTGYDLGVIGGVEYRIVADLADPTRILAVQNTGQSGQPGSPHYADQLQSWLSGAYHTVHLTREGVEADLEGVTRLIPDA